MSDLHNHLHRNYHDEDDLGNFLVANVRGFVCILSVRVLADTETHPLFVRLYFTVYIY